MPRLHLRLWRVIGSRKEGASSRRQSSVTGQGDGRPTTTRSGSCRTVDVEKEDDLERYLQGQLFTNNKTGRHSRDSDWKVADARKRHRMDLLLSKRKTREGLVVYATMRRVGCRGCDEVFAFGG